MSWFTKLGAEIWRLYETDGVPATGAHNVIKSDMQDWMATVESLTGWKSVVKTAIETRNSTTTLAVDATLKFTMAANTVYLFRARIFIDTAATPDFKWRHTGPASPTRVTIKRSCIVPAATALSNIAIDTAYSAADVTMTAASGTRGWLELEGVIENGANAGDFEFQWAQNTSDAGDTSVLPGSFLDYRVVA